MTGSSDADVFAKYQSDRSILNANLAASRLSEILQKTSIGYWNWAQFLALCVIGENWAKSFRKMGIYATKLVFSVLLIGNKSLVNLFACPFTQYSTIITIWVLILLNADLVMILYFTSFGPTLLPFDWLND